MYTSETLTFDGEMLARNVGEQFPDQMHAWTKTCQNPPEKMLKKMCCKLNDVDDDFFFGSMFMKDLLHLLFPQQLVHCFLCQLLLFFRGGIASHWISMSWKYPQKKLGPVSQAFWLLQFFRFFGNCALQEFSLACLAFSSSANLASTSFLFSAWFGASF